MSLCRAHIRNYNKTTTNQRDAVQVVTQKLPKPAALTISQSLPYQFSPIFDSHMPHQLQ